MAIITKPAGGIFKGIPATITLNKSELAALSSVSSDSYFSVTTNWNKVILSYKSFEGNQQEIVEFDATLASPTGFFDVSTTARNLFEIQVIKIIDFDGGIFIVPRSELVTADFDVIFVSPPSSLSYTTPVIYTQNEEITNNVPSVIGTVTLYSISPALPTGLTINSTTGVISGTPTVVSAAANYTVTASNSGGSTTAIVNITVEEVPVIPGAIQWNINANYTFNNSTGGMTTINTNMVDGFAISTTSTFLPSQDKSTIYTLDASSITVGSTFGYYSADPSNYFSFRKESGNSATQINVYSQAGFYSTVSIPSSGSIELKIQSKGSTSETKWFINGIEVASRGGAGSGPMYPKVLLFSGSSISTAIVE